MEKAKTPKVTVSKPEKIKTAKVPFPPHITAINALKKYLKADKNFAEAVRHNLDGMLYTAAKSRIVRRNKSNISLIDLEAIVKEIAPNIMRVFENH